MLAPLPQPILRAPVLHHHHPLAVPLPLPLLFPVPMPVTQLAS